MSRSVKRGREATYKEVRVCGGVGLLEAPCRRAHGAEEGDMTWPIFRGDQNFISFVVT